MTFIRILEAVYLIGDLLPKVQEALIPNRKALQKVLEALIPSRKALPKVPEALIPSRKPLQKVLEALPKIKPLKKVPKARSRSLGTPKNLF